nr:hypothetical protein BaRGS_029602 [Batillaria attramentaria]
MSTCGEVKVVKRIGSDAEEKRLREIIPHLKLTAEVAVLEKEARELYAFGLKDLAASRYGEAQRLKRLQG